MPSFRDRVKNKVQRRNRRQGKNDDTGAGCLGIVFGVLAVIFEVLFGGDQSPQTAGGRSGANPAPPRRPRPTESDGSASVNWGTVEPADNTSNNGSNGTSSGGSFDAGGGEWGGGGKS